MRCPGPACDLLRVAPVFRCRAASDAIAWAGRRGRNSMARPAGRNSRAMPPVRVGKSLHGVAALRRVPGLAPALAQFLDVDDAAVADLEIDLFVAEVVLPALAHDGAVAILDLHDAVRL